MLVKEAVNYLIVQKNKKKERYCLKRMETITKKHTSLFYYRLNCDEKRLIIVII